MKDESKFIVKTGAIVAALGTIVGSVFALDGRYVHATEFKKEIVQIKDQIDDLYRARLEDELFKLELVPEAKRTQADKALIERYRRQVQEIEQKRRERRDR